MLDWVREVIARHKTHGILTDASILLLLLVGTFDRDRIAKFKNTEKFAPEDYDLLVGLLGRFDRIVVTPHVLTEVSNLAGQLGEPARQKCMTLFGQLIGQFLEEAVPSVTAAQESVFPLLGLTDAGIAHLVADKYPVITTDAVLCGILASRGIDAINFNHIRRASWKQ
jgi:hypothetical protein